MAAVLILAACGGADEGAGSPVDAPSEPTDTTAPGGDDLRAPTPIEVVSGGAGDRSANADAEVATVAAADAPAGEMRMAQWVAEYVVGDGMPALPTNDTGYVFDASAPVTAERVAAIAAALGLTGEPQRIDEGYGVRWRVGPDDGSAASLWVSDDAQQNWNYSTPWDAVFGEVCPVSRDAAGNDSSDCPAPTPPTGVPTADEAELRAGELLTALGVDPSGLHFETHSDKWFANVDASDRTDDRAATRSWYFGFGAEGAMQFAGGTLAPTQPVGPYPLVDLDTAVARLADGFYGGFGGGVAVADSAGAVTEPAMAVEEPPPADEPPADEPVTDEPVLIDPMPVEPPLPVEPVVVTLVDVQPDLWWAWDADGTVWLLPAYRFIDSEGGWHVAPAVTDEYLIQADPVMIDEPIPVEPDGGIGDGAEPVTTPESVPPVEIEDSAEAPEDSAGDPDVVDIEPGTDPEAAIPLLEESVGLSIEEFASEAKAAGFETRVVMQDGESLAVTMDYRTDRVNVVVEGPRVVAIDSIG
jgi:hypothetical protein